MDGFGWDCCCYAPLDDLVQSVQLPNSASALLKNGFFKPVQFFFILLSSLTVVAVFEINFVLLNRADVTFFCKPVHDSLIGNRKKVIQSKCDQGRCDDQYFIQCGVDILMHFSFRQFSALLFFCQSRAG